GEVHVHRAAELGLGAQPEFVLRERVHHQVHRVPGPQFRAHPQVRGGSAGLAQHAEQLLPLGCQQGGETPHRVPGLSRRLDRPPAPRAVGARSGSRPPAPQPWSRPPALPAPAAALCAALVPALWAALVPALWAALVPSLWAALVPALWAALVPALWAALVPS